MNKPTRVAVISVVSILIALGTAGSSCRPVPPTDENALTVEVLLDKVHQALKMSEPCLSGLSLPLKSATLTLQTVATQRVGGGIQLWVVSVGSSVQQEATQELTLTLIPTPPAKGISTTRSAVPLEEQLAQAVCSATAALKTQPNQSPSLTAKALQASVSFVVERSSDGKVGLTIRPVTASLSGELKNKAVQKVTLLFEH